MIRCLVALSLVACGPTPRTADPARSASAVAPAASATDSAPGPTVHALRDALEAPHGGSIQLLALSPDGRIAISADELGGVRLWPTLDGTQEPRIVEMPQPIQLAVGRRQGGYTAAVRDHAGGVYIAKLDEAIRQLSHATLPAEPAVTWIGMTERGLLAWRSDQRLLLLDADGVPRDQLATEPSQHIAAIAVSGTRAVVLLDRGGGRRAVRWLALAPKLEWGGWLTLDEELGGDVVLALAPGGQRLAAAVRADRKTIASVFDLATGKRIGGGEAPTSNATIGFVDDDRIALGGFEAMYWIDLTAPETKPTGRVSIPFSTRTRPTLATGAGRAVLAHHGELALHTFGGDPQYLGYETMTPRIAGLGPDGYMVIGQGDHIVLLDRDLRAEATPFSGLAGTFAQLRWLGGARWLLETSSPRDGKMQIQLLDTDGPPKILRSGLPQVQVLHHEPSTELVTLSLGASPQVARFDRKARRLDLVATPAKRGRYDQVILVPVSPELAGGIQLVQIRMHERMTIDWLRNPRALDKPAATTTVDGSFAGADAVGHVYAWQSAPSGALELVVYKDGKPLRTLPNHGAVALWPEPQGRGYVEVASTSVALYDMNGVQRWQQSLTTSQEALWLTDGALAITSAGGVARLDAATGAITAARCGWRFGLAPKPHPATPRAEPLCAQLPR